jgi:hypothetical protein
MTRARYILTSLKEDKASGRAKDILRKFAEGFTEAGDNEERKRKPTPDSDAQKIEEGKGRSHGKES